MRRRDGTPPRARASPRQSKGCAKEQNLTTHADKGVVSQSREATRGQKNERGAIGQRSLGNGGGTPDAIRRINSGNYFVD